MQNQGRSVLVSESSLQTEAMRPTIIFYVMTENITQTCSLNSKEDCKEEPEEIFSVQSEYVAEDDSSHLLSGDAESLLRNEIENCTVCQEIENRDEMVQCDGCQLWNHLKCLRVSKRRIQLMNEYFCPACDTNSSARPSSKRSELINS